MFWNFLEWCIKILSGVSSTLNVLAFWKKDKKLHNISPEKDSATPIHENSIANNNSVYLQSENCGNQYVNSTVYITPPHQDPKISTKKREAPPRKGLFTVFLIIATIIAVAGATYYPLFLSLILTLLFFLVNLYQFHDGKLRYRIAKSSLESKHLWHCLLAPLPLLGLLLSRESVIGLNCQDYHFPVFSSWMAGTAMDELSKDASLLFLILSRTAGFLLLFDLLWNLIIDTKSLTKHRPIQRLASRWWHFVVSFLLLGGAFYYIFILSAQGISFLSEKYAAWRRELIESYTSGEKL